jgi:PmbA protein
MQIAQTLSNSDLSNIVAEIIRLAKSKPGVTAVAAGGSLSTGLSTTVRLGAVETVEFNRDKSLGITIYKDKRKGSVAISDLSKTAIDMAVNAACRIADYTEPDEFSGLADKDLLATSIVELDLYHPAAITAEQAIEYAKQAEAAALNADPRIENTEGAAFSTHDSYYVFGNSDGFLQGYSKTSYQAHCTAIAEANGTKQRDYDYTVARDVNNLVDMSEIGLSAANRTLARLGAKQIKTCSAPVLFVPEMARGLWRDLVAAISGGNLYRKTSFLVDKLNTKILPDFINISEEPFLENGLGSAPFDDEGVSTSTKQIIESGILKTYLLSCYAARRLNMRSTGNAGGVHNMLVHPGSAVYSQLLHKMDRGLVVTELLGQGTNIVNGDYSHAAFGYWVEDGVIKYPVEEITIAGNLLDMMQNIVAIGSDLDFRSNIITGSVLIDGMTIAGA